MRRILAFLGFLTLAVASRAESAPVRPVAPLTVFLDRDGESRAAHGRDRAVEIPAYGGGDRAWSAIVGCVRKQYAPFDLRIVETPPAGGRYITAVVGGRPSALGLGRTTNGVGPYNGRVIPDAVVHVFSQAGPGERAIENVCAVAAHEIGHALGLDHELYCGDIMSYYVDQCGARRFVDASAPCGEHAARACGNAARTQDSYRLLARNVGLRAKPARPPAPRLVARRKQQPQPHRVQSYAHDHVRN